MTSKPLLHKEDTASTHERERKHQKRYAKRWGYYWLPCIICGEEHGGHEAGGVLLDADLSGGVTICPFCTAERQEWAERKLAELRRIKSVQCGRWWKGSGTVEHQVGADPVGRRLR